MIKIEKISNEEIIKRGINNWPIWEKEISKFDWVYDSDEECLILEGEVEVFYNNTSVNIKKGDFVTFPKGLKCRWEVSKNIRKHYNFL